MIRNMSMFEPNRPVEPSTTPVNTPDEVAAALRLLTRLGASDVADAIGLVP